jgi:hypothetical protein
VMRADANGDSCLDNMIGFAQSWPLKRTRATGADTVNIAPGLKTAFAQAHAAIQNVPRACCQPCFRRGPGSGCCYCLFSALRSSSICFCCSLSRRS